MREFNDNNKKIRASSSHLSFKIYPRYEAYENFSNWLKCCLTSVHVRHGSHMGSGKIAFIAMFNARQPAAQ